MAVSRRNYAAMKDAKLMKCLSELEEAVLKGKRTETSHKCIQYGGDAKDDLQKVTQIARQRKLITANPQTNRAELWNPDETIVIVPGKGEVELEVSVLERNADSLEIAFRVKESVQIECYAIDGTLEETAPISRDGLRWQQAIGVDRGSHSIRVARPFIEFSATSGNDNRKSRVFIGPIDPDLAMAPEDRRATFKEMCETMVAHDPELIDFMLNVNKDAQRTRLVGDVAAAEQRVNPRYEQYMEHGLGFGGRKQGKTFVQNVLGS